MEAAQQRVGIDVVLVIDASKSMKTNDPQDLRKVGAKEFIDLARPGDRIALVEFGGTTRDLAPLTAIRDEATRQQLKARVDQISSGINDTDIGKAIAHAYEVLDDQHDPAHHQYILFLTDGETDLDAGPAAEQASKRKLYGQTLPRLRQRGWVVYTVGLSKEADRRTMEDIVEQTRRRVGGKVKGLHETTPTAKEVPPVYARIMRQMVDWVTLDDERSPNEFKVDPSVDDRAIFAVNKDPGTQTTVTLPDGQSVGAEGIDSVPGMKGSSTPDYDIITADQPQRGTYKFSFDGGQGRVQGFAESNLWLQLQEVKRQVEQEEAVRLAATLMRQNTPVPGGDPLLQNLQMLAEIEGPNGQLHTCSLADTGLYGDPQKGDGQFAGYFTQTTAEGPYQVVARAHGGSFNRTSDPQRFQVVRPASVYVKTDKGSYQTGDPVGIIGGLTKKVPWVSDTKFEVEAFTPKAERRRFDLFDDGNHQDGRAGDREFANTFKETENAGPYTFIVQASGRKQTGQPITVTRALFVKVGAPDITITPGEADYGELTLKQHGLKTFTAESSLDHEERLRVTLTPADRVQLELRQNGEVVEEITVPANGKASFTASLKPTTGEKTEGQAELQFAPQQTHAMVEPERLPIRFTIVPLPPWWRFWLILLAILLAALLLAWLIYLFTRPPLQGKLFITAPDKTEREYRLHNRGFLGLRRTMLIGRDPRCDIALKDDPDLQPRHAQIWRQKIAGRRRLAVLDLTTKRKRFLKDGDELELGQHLARYENFRDK